MNHLTQLASITRRRPGKRDRRGAILGVVMIVVLVFGILGVGLLSASNINTLQATRACWVAEAGLQSAMAKLRITRDFRLRAGTLTQSFGDGTFSVTVSRVAPFRAFKYHLTSAGTVYGAMANVTQDVTIISPWHPTFVNYGLFGGGLFDDPTDVPTGHRRHRAGTMRIDHGVQVYGDIFQYGKIEFRHNSSVEDGVVYATDGIRGHGNFTEAPEPPSPMPTMPALDTTYYDNQIRLADHEGVKTQEVDNLSLNGGTVMIDGHLRMRDGGSITGPGTLVVAKEVHLERGVTIGDNVTIIAGKDLTIKKNSVVGANVILYASKKIEVTEDGTVLDGGVLISRGEVKLRKDSSIEGVVVYSGGKAVKIEDHTTFTGAVVSGDKLEVKKDSQFTHDPTSLPETVPIGLEQNTNGWSAVGSNWASS